MSDSRWRRMLGAALAATVLAGIATPAGARTVPSTAGACRTTAGDTSNDETMGDSAAAPTAARHPP